MTPSDPGQWGDGSGRINDLQGWKRGRPSPLPPIGHTSAFCGAQQRWATTPLLALLARVVAAGERIVLSRHGQPIAQLVPLDPSPRRPLGFLQGRVDEAFFEPLANDELERWG